MKISSSVKFTVSILLVRASVTLSGHSKQIWWGFFRDGLRRRSQPDVLYKTPVAVVEVDKKKVTEEPIRSGGILSKFRKDSTGKKGRHLTSMACLNITIPFLCCIVLY